MKFLDAPVTTQVTVQYDEVIEKAADLISAQLGLKENGRWFAIQFLEHAPGIEEKFEGINLEKVHQVVQETDQHFEGNTDIEITNARYELVSRIAEKVVVREGDVTGTLTDRIPNHRRRSQRRNPQQDSRPAGSFHVRQTGRVHEESEPFMPAISNFTS